jgi:chloramphenicol-sensitive protein RarD
MWGFFSIPLRNIKSYPAEQILYYRILTSLVITWVTILIFRKKAIKADFGYIHAQTAAKKRELLILMLVAGVLITGNWFTFIYAVNNISLKSAAFAYMVCPLITALGGFMLLKENLTKIKLLALSIALISIIILASGSLKEVLWSVFIAALYAFYLIIQRVIKQIDKFNMLAFQLLISVLLMMPLYISQFNGLPSAVYFWENILFISIVFTIIPLFLSMYALVGLPSSTMGIIIYINPVVSFAVAFTYFNEQVDAQQLVAYLLLIIAVVIFNSQLIREIISKPAAKASL